MPTGADDPRTDAQLVEAANSGSVDAFESLYRRYRDWVVNLAFRYTRDRELALDVMQETFIYLLGKFEQRGGLTLTAKMTTFLFPVVRHIAIRQRDKARRTQGVDLNQAAPESAKVRVANAPTPESPRDALAVVLSSLPEAQRECVLLRFVDGFTLEEIAAALDIPTGTVKSRLHHALKTLRDDPAVRDYFAPD